jgi:hypothetical protein
LHRFQGPGVLEYKDVVILVNANHAFLHIEDIFIMEIIDIAQCYITPDHLHQRKIIILDGKNVRKQQWPVITWFYLCSNEVSSVL